MNSDGTTALHTAAHNGQADCVKALLAREALVDPRDKYGDTPLHKCVVNGHYMCIETLIQYGANINMQNKGKCIKVAICNMYLRRRYSFEKSDLSWTYRMCQNFNRKRSPIQFRIRKEHIGASFRCFQRPSRLCRFLPFRYRFLILALLIEKGAVVDLRDESGMTPLFFAAVNGHRDCMELLIDHRADVNSRDAEGKTPLHTVVRRGYLECAKLLIERGADVNCIDDVGWTPLHEATSEDNTGTFFY